MSACSLNISIQEADLATILAAGEMVTIVAGVEAIVTSALVADTAGGAVAWLAFSPFSSNQVSWSPQDYQLYAANAAQPGVPLHVLSQSTAADAAFLPFKAGAFQASVGTLSAGTYGVENNQADHPSMVFGLALGAIVNDAASPAGPMNASLVPLNQNAQFSPNGTIQVFLQTQTLNGMVLPNSIADVTAYPIGAGALTLRYDSTTGSFVKT